MNKRVVPYSRQEGHNPMCTPTYKSHTVVHACSLDITEEEGPRCPDPTYISGYICDRLLMQG